MSVCVGSLFPCVITEGFWLYCLFCKHRLRSAMNHSAPLLFILLQLPEIEQLMLVEACQLWMESV